jgi:glycosyltransferase involved in cell wall biosynthesis
MKLSVVLPVFNEESILEEACCEFSIYFNKTIGEDEWQFVFSENGSNDNSSIIIDELIKKAAWNTDEDIEIATNEIVNSIASLAKIRV